MSDAPLPAPLTSRATVGHESGFSCPNCGQSNTGKFCTNCGQKEIHAGDLSLKHAWHHLVHELLHVDGKVFNSLKLLLTHPGALTVDFFAGRRARHIHPIRLFLVVGFVFFLFARVTSMYELSFQFLEKSPQEAGWIGGLFAKTGMTTQQFSDRANERVQTAFKTIYIVAVLTQGFWMWVMFRRKRPFLAENMVAVLHIACFYMIVAVALGPLRWLHLKADVGQNISLLLGFGYFLLAARHVYGGSWWGLVLKGLLLQLFTALVMGIGVMIVVFAVLLGH